MAEVDKEALYDQIISYIFFKHFKKGMRDFVFLRTEIEEAVTKLGIKAALNKSDVVYSYRFRKELPGKIQATAPKDSEWIINLAGRGRYHFELVDNAWIKPSEGRVVIKVPDVTPAIIAEHALNDEQALLAILRYNRLVDTFFRATCYSLQNHLRTSVKGIGQIEVDELYLGVDRRGVQYVIPVQAKGGNDKIGIVQARQDIAFCNERFPNFVCRPLAAQFMKDNVVALMELLPSDGKILICAECHFRLVPKGGVSPEDLESYRRIPDE